VVRIVSGVVALGVVGSNAVILGVWEPVSKVDAQLRGSAIASPVLENGVALDRVAEIRLSGSRHWIAEDGDAAGAIELNKVARPSCCATDQVEGNTGFIGLRGAEGRKEAVR